MNFVEDQGLSDAAWIIPNLLDPSDSFSSGASEVYFPLSGAPFGGGNPQPVVIPAEAVEAQAAQNGSGGTGSVVAATSGGLTINLIYDAAAMAAPQSFRDGIQQAANLLSAAVSDKITLNFKIDYSGTGGGAAAGPDNGFYENYSSIRSDLINNASPGDATFNALPAGSTIQGQSSVAVWNAQLKLWGILGANDTTTDDGSATFATDINSSLLVGVALHELTHAMGRVPYGPQPDIFDFFRFTSPGGRLFQDGATAPAAYFSLDGGNTKLADYGQTSDPSDFLNSGVQGSNDPYNEFYGNNTLQHLTAMDLKQLDALGFHLVSNNATVIESLGSTSLTQVGNDYFLYANGTSTGPELKNGGAPVVTGQYNGWALIGGEQTASGYDVAWKAASTGQYAVWSVDSNGNYLSNIVNVVPGTDVTLQSLETSFHQDLNSDGVIGLNLPTTVIESFGSTSLTQVGNDYFLFAKGTSTGPELQYGGAPVVTGEFSGWALIGGEQTASGYEVAWKNAGTGKYAVWSTDGNGNYISNIVDGVAGTDATLQSLETSFHQDLNSDGVIGLNLPTTVIESFGSTSLTQVGNDYFLFAKGTSTGPELQYGGAPVVTGEFSGWALIGGEQTASGYEVAWENAGTGKYAVWSTDGNGNYISNIVDGVAGTDATLQSLETSFHQDLNSDGVIGLNLPTTVIESFGSTSLTQVGNDYFLFAKGTSTGPELQYGGAPVVTGEFSGWALIGGEQTASGYEVAWKNAGTGKYAVWSTDGNGNYISNIVDGVAGTDATLQSLETSFHQDLNGDGVVGVPAHTVPANVSAAAPAVADSFLFRATPDSLFSGGKPELDAFHFGNSTMPVADLYHAPASQPHPLLTSPYEGPAAPSDLGGHDNGPPANSLNLHLADLHASGFMIG